MSTHLIPSAVLDRVLEQPIGKGILLKFPNKEDRERFRWRCYSAMGVETRLSMKEFDPSSSNWGKHPWQGVVIKRRGDYQLWFGLTLDTGVVIAEGVPETEEEGSHEQTALK